jgi:hypothetical protein
LRPPVWVGEAASTDAPWFSCTFTLEFGFYTQLRNRRAEGLKFLRSALELLAVLRRCETRRPIPDEISNERLSPTFSTVFDRGFEDDFLMTNDLH